MGDTIVPPRWGAMECIRSAFYSFLQIAVLHRFRQEQPVIIFIVAAVRQILREESRIRAPCIDNVLFGIVVVAG